MEGLSRQQQIAAYHGNVKTQEERDRIIDALGGEEEFAEQVQANLDEYKNIVKRTQEENKESLRGENLYLRTSSRLVDSLFNRRQIPLDLSLIERSEDDVLGVALGRANFKKHLQRFNINVK